ncbi:MAG: adenylate/guanylate cyclase domain-containing protein [Paracoccaceae bacterium]
MTEASVHRHLSAILIADIVGYSRLIGVDEAGTLAAVKSRWALVLRPCVEGHEGRIIKFMGDGVLVEFSSATSAVECALAVQEGMARANAAAAETPPIILRMGISLGDVVVDGGDIFGEGVNIAARLEPLAQAGELCISASVYEAVRGKVALAAEDLGRVDLKNISQPVQVFRVSSGDAPAGRIAPVAPVENTLSIAVLPFDNMSGVPENDYIGEGIAENIIADLSRFRDIAVIARNSSFAYKGKATRIQDVRRDLGVNYILEGSIQRAADRIRVSAQLVGGESGKHLWVEKYDRRVDDLFAVMDEITELIVGTLGTTYGGRLRKSASETASGAGPTSFRAFDHFVQGMQELNKFTEQSVASSITHFETAIRLEPRYAKAHAKLAWAHLINVHFGWTGDGTSTLEVAQNAADRAVWADDAEAWAHWAVAGCALTELRHDRALDGMRRAIELNPNDADVLTDMGLFCSYAGQPEEGLIHALKGIKLNPHHPEYYADQLGQIYFDARQYDNAIRTLEAIRSLSTPSMLVCLAASHAALGHHESARAQAATLLEREPQSTASYWTNLIPYCEDRDREHLATNLRLAGLPE